MPARVTATPIATATAKVAAKLRVSCWAAATGTTIRALTSSSPTTRMATVTVTAAVTADQQIQQPHRQAGHPGELLVLADREQLAAQARA